MGLYTTPDPTNAVASWTVSRSGVPGLLTVLTMTERRGSSERQHQYAYDRQQRIWTLDYPDDLRQDTVQLVANGSNRFYIGTVKGPGGAEVYHVEQQFEQFAWGSGLVHQQIGVGTNQLITTYTYSPGGFSAFDGMANGNAVPLEQVNFPDGRWERYVYDDDGRLTQRIGPFLNADEDAPSSECRTVAYVYQDGAGVWQPRVPRVELAKVQDWPVQRTLRDLTEFTFSEARCLDLTTTNLNATGNLLTVRRYYQAPANLKHLLQSIQLPDGTREAYFYSIQNGYQTNVVLRGQPDPASLTNVLSGTKTVISLGSFGQVLRRKVQDLQTGIVLADDQYQCTDEWLRSYQVTHLDQTVEQFQYGCCGLEQSIDRDGVATTYQYDSLRRRVETQRLAIRTTNQLDAIGNALTTVRLGTNGTDAIVLDRSAYDVGGRRYVQTNALGGVTLFSEGRDSGSGGITNRVIYPDGSVRLERRARDGSLLEASGTATHPQQFLYGIDTPGEVGPEGPMYLPFTVQINLGATGATNEWTRTYQDRFGRDYKTIYPDPTPDDLSDNPARQTWFNTKGQVWKERDPDGVVLLYGYNAKGERDYAALDLNRNDAIDFGGTDRITWTTNDVTTYSGINVRRTRMIVYTNNNSTAILTNAMTQTAVSGLKTWQTGYRDSATAATTVTESVYGTNGTRTVNVTAPDGSSSVTVHSYGRPQSVTRKDSGGAQVAQTSYQYDSHGRPWKVTDARNGTTVTTYNEADQVLTVTAPPLGTGEPAQVTRTFYDSQGRVTGTQLPDGATRTNFLAPTGLTLLTQGGRSYPVAYTYDAQGRPQTMTTWKDFAGNAGAATNQWTYDEQGRLRAKHYPDPISGAVVAGSGPVYTNSPAGRLQTRDWKRGVRTAYAYNAAGDLASVTYSDGTPGVAYTYDRRGRLATVARNGITTALTYNDANQPLTEMHSGGTLGGLSMNWAYDTSLRLTTVMAKNGANTLQSATHGYDAAGRLQSVTDSPRSAAYKYHANSLLISTVTLTNSGTAGLVSSRAYDKLDRLLSINSGTSSNGVAVAALSYGYQYNGANQRTRRIEADGTYWVYGYDALGQVVSGRRYWADGTAVAGQQFEYGFDDIGNRKSSGGRASAVGSYTNSLLNQITGRGVAPSMDVLGLANPTTNVTVGIQGGTAYTASRKGEYFHYPLTVANATAQYPQIEVKSLYGATQTDTGLVFVPPAGEVFQHDADGNLIQDGRWTYTWDGENRLVQMLRDTPSPTGARQKLVFEYDHQGRRIRKQFFTLSGTNWVEQRDTICLYEGWNVVAELDANASNARLRTYVWGLDLSGTRQGAGGVGGLLWVNNYQTSYGGQTLPTGVQYAAYDGNGNVVGLAKAADGTLSARYEYGPFGETVRQTGALADAQPFRFSTEWTDAESGFVCYGYRYYYPSAGRWLSRDPLGERGGVNLHGFVANNPVLLSDRNGLDFGTWVGHPGYDWEPPTRAPRLLTTDDLERIRVALDNEVKKTLCCCASREVRPGLDLHIAGTAAGATVTENLTVKPIGCIEEDSYQYYWWDCANGQSDYANAGKPPELDWHEFGWEPGTASRTKAHKGISTWWYDHYLDWTDAGHWNWAAKVIFIYCGKDGRRHASVARSNYEMWEWDTNTKSWSNPQSGEVR
jgi:RHS repeat-associated protein